ncbi:MAG: glycosyltransferase family 39 protein, partial [Gemmatimonadales bacterium]|nr:glycosyltransferase family 39 protein [Gemmatimonadales bacterium]
AGVALGIHVVTNLITPYEFHRDELLYFAMGTHLRLFHMDFPPLIALLSETVRVVAGASLFAYRMVPAIAGSVVVLLALLIARELGGARLAIVLTAIAIIFNPLFLRSANLFQPVVLDQVWWLLGFYALVRLEHTDDPKWWLLLGTAGGLGLLSKFSILFLGLAVLIGLLLTRRRRAFLGPWPWVALGVALLVGMPTVIGQIALGFPVLQQMEGLRQVQLARVTFGDYVMGQALWGPGFLLAGTGLIALLVLPALGRYRLLGWVTLTAFVLFAIAKGKSYYVGPIYPMLYAAGAVWIDRLLRPRVRATLAWMIAVLMVGYGLATLPFGLPVVPPEPMARYARATGITAGVTTNTGEILPLPQDYADMLGWKEQADAVARVFHTLTPAEQADAVLYGGNYGEAGALDLYGRRLGLPPVISLAGSFFNFGPGTRSGRVVILLGIEPEELDVGFCRSLVVAARVTNPWGVPEEQDVPVLVCREPSLTPQELWLRVGEAQWG